MQFFISTLATRLRTRRFSEPTFRPSWPTNPSKTQCLATVVTVCAPAFFFLTLSLSLFYPSLLLFSSTLLLSAFHLSILSEVSFDKHRPGVVIFVWQTGRHKFRSCKNHQNYITSVKTGHMETLKCNENDDVP